MLNFVTGLPGSGKTLFTIQYVEKYREEEHKRMQKDDPDAKLRPVYQYGINELKLDWQQLEDVKEWYKLPEGSIIIVDEAQQHFAPMANGAKRPEHYLKFDVHRHSGYDIFLITQDAANVDIRVKSMAGRHYHHNRSYGLESSTLYQWESVHRTDDYNLKRDRDAVKSQFSFPKEVYELYKSAKVHTHKRSLPWKKIVPIIALFVGLIALVTFGLTWLGTKEEKMSGKANEAIQQAGVMTANGQTIAGGIYSDASAFMPTIPDVPQSAPVYAQFAKIRSMQRIDGCMSVQFNGIRQCSCNDQQGNKVRTSTAFCETYIQDGFFDVTREEEGRPQTIDRDRTTENPFETVFQ